ncbi:uncharacterized protein LOC127728102 [Mytilus californianus]|uniref:uncharacterized protein LOC127728102 n=1 Tax=Mytilus californianus TaxID=6549 RepID=UPI00224647D4|nr:uncharacterized protein LOC127728102 [Mytilus californianus]
MSNEEDIDDITRRLEKFNPNFFQRSPSSETVKSSFREHQITNATNQESESIEPNKNESGTSEACIQCITPIPALVWKDICPGDHIIFAGRIYDHHAIVVHKYPINETDENRVCLELVHATNTATKAFMASFHPFGNKAKLRKVKEDIDLTKSKVMIYVYQNTIKHFNPDEIIKRAIAEADADAEGGKGEFKYDLFVNNCEHFATWCVTGQTLSLQVRKVGMIVKMFFRSGFRGISDENQRNEKEFKSGMLCKTCYERNKQLLCAEKTTIQDKNHVQIGEIIMYSYYNLWHCAVVLEIIETTEKVVQCKIAHNAFCGFWKHRTIQEDPLPIPLDGSMFVITYSEEYNVYEPQEVVKRARSRIGEQLFAFFSNDSSQFARWCKLKLHRDEKNVTRTTRISFKT